MSEQSPITSPQPDLDRQLLVMMVGVPGSGKTSFARPLADRLNAYRFNLDRVGPRLEHGLTACPPSA